MNAREAFGVYRKIKNDADLLEKETGLDPEKLKIIEDAVKEGYLSVDLPVHSTSSTEIKMLRKMGYKVSVDRYCSLYSRPSITVSWDKRSIFVLIWEALKDTFDF